MDKLDCRNCFHYPDNCVAFKNRGFHPCISMIPKNESNDKIELKEIEEWKDSLGGIIIPPEDWSKLKERLKINQEIKELVW